MSLEDKEVRNVFVIMPFTSTPSRDSADLTTFFLHNLKRPLENAHSLQYRYVVSRSDDAFRITDTIILSLYGADLVLCDLSGEQANPNVMFELGVRLALTHKPVIMFREEHPSNKPIFDVQSYYIHPYSPLRYPDLETFLLNKVAALETETKGSQSPVLSALQYAPSIAERLRHRAAMRQMRMFLMGVDSVHARWIGEVARFLKGKTSVPLPANDVDLTRVIFEDAAAFRALDWSAFVIPSLRVPALEAYLADPMVFELVPEQVESDFTLYTQLFFDSFLNNSSGGLYGVFDHVLVGLVEFILFRQMVGDVTGCLIYEPPGNLRFARMFNDRLAQSKFKPVMDAIRSANDDDSASGAAESTTKGQGTDASH